MCLDDALKLVHSGGRVVLEYGKLQLTEKRGVLFVSINERQAIVAEKTVCELYWKESWLAC